MLDFYDYHDLWHILSSFALLMGVHIVIFASYDPDTITRGNLPSDYARNNGIRGKLETGGLLSGN